MKSFLLYMLLEFIPLTVVAVMGVVLWWSWYWGITIHQTVFAYAGNL